MRKTPVAGHQPDHEHQSTLCLPLHLVRRQTTTPRDLSGAGQRPPRRAPTTPAVLVCRGSADAWVRPGDAHSDPSTYPVTQSGPNVRHTPRKEADHGKTRSRRQGSRLHPARPGRQEGLLEGLRRAAGSSSTSTRGTTRRAAPRRPASSTTTSTPSPRPRCRSSGCPATAPRSTRSSGPSTASSFPLLTDADHKVGEAYGAWGEKTLYGKKSIGVIRSTFLVAADGTIERAWYHVKADGHAAKVLAELES